MAEVYAVIGEANTRKSSTVRCLTGVSQRRLVTVMTATGPIDIFVQIQALQEATISPAAFIGSVANANYPRVLVPLRDTGFNGQPPGADYIAQFMGAGWPIHQIVVLGAGNPSHPLPAGTPNANFVPGSANAPVNQTAAQIRGWWGWL
jgi:hypothetical protein